MSSFSPHRYYLIRCRIEDKDLVLTGPSLMASLNIITGTPGAGKTSLAKRLASDAQRGVHIPGDLFFTFIPRLIEPTDPESHEQNTSVVLAMTRAATAFVAGGYDVYLDAVVGPWFLPVVAAELRELEVPIVYAILRLPLEEALRRAKERDQCFDEKIARKLHPQFEAVGPYEKHVIDITGLSPDDVLERFHELRWRCILDVKELADAME
jgi:chloramphenicol 3-O-phosphotransferase